MTTTTITLPATVLAGIAQLAVFTPQKKSDADMTPIIAQVEVTLTAGTDEDRLDLTAIATDRYVVGEYRTTVDTEALSALSTGESFSFLIPAATLKSLKLGGTDVRFSADWTITIDAVDRTEHYSAQYTEATVTIQGPLRSVVGHASGGNYPRVNRLMPAPGADLEPLSPVYALNVANIARIATVRDPQGLKTPTADESAWKLHGTGTTASGKPMPVLWTHDYGNGHAYRVLQQPNLIR